MTFTHVAATKAARLAIFDGPGKPLRLEQLAFPDVAADEILVKVLCCTLCGSDLHTFTGRRPVQGPTILGHEILGRVVQVSADVRHRVAVGDRVTWTLCDSCGECEFCGDGMPQKCLRLRKYGHEPDAAWPLSGGLAEYCCLRPGTAVYRVPDLLPDTIACPANCATATVVAALRAGGAIEGRLVLIFGCGMLGLTAAAMAQYQGARQVIMADIDEARAARGPDFGATSVVAGERSPDRLRAEVHKATRGRGADVILEMSGAPEAVEQGLELCRIGGTLVLVGSTFPSRTVPLSAERVVRGLMRIRGVHNYDPDDLVFALDFLTATRDRYPFEGLVEAVFPLDDAEHAFQHALASRAIRVAVIP